MFRLAHALLRIAKSQKRAYPQRMGALRGLVWIGSALPLRCARACGTRKGALSSAYPALIPQRAVRASETYRAIIGRPWRDWCNLGMGFGSIRDMCLGNCAAPTALGCCV